MHDREGLPSDMNLCLLFFWPSEKISSELLTCRKDSGKKRVRKPKDRDRVREILLWGHLHE